MSTKKVTLSLVLFLSVLLGFSQDKTRKQLREIQKIENQKQIKKIIESKEFRFEAQKALPQGFKIIDLTTNYNFINFKPDFIQSDMPFFGRGYSGIGYGGSDVGLKFEGIPDNFIVKNNKKGYQINVSVKGKNDNYNLLLSVSFEGSATLSINSNNRSSISYIGRILELEKKE